MSKSWQVGTLLSLVEEQSHCSHWRIGNKPGKRVGSEYGRPQMPDIEFIQATEMQVDSSKRKTKKASNQSNEMKANFMKPNRTIRV